MKIDNNGNVSSDVGTVAWWDGEYQFEWAKVTADTCLFYTSDAADEGSSVDLGGLRIIKKKNNRVHGGAQTVK
mgnify:CR=1 FL=1